MERIQRKKLYEQSLVKNIDIKPFYFHISFVNWQGSGKDLLINADLYSMYFDKRSIFDDIIRLIFKRYYYCSEIRNLYANCKLNKEVFGDDYYLVKSKQDILDSHDGILYLHDAELYFKNIGMNMRTDSNDIIQFINNKRKDKISLRLSMHRFMSIHVRVRELIPMWVKPDMYCDDLRDYSKLNNYQIFYKVYDCDGNKLCINKLGELYKYCRLYDTDEKAKSF